jgi:hypothetical protein
VKFLINTTKVFCGVALLIVGLGGGVGLCLSSPKAFKLMLVSGTPVSCPVGGSEVKVPGRLVAAVLISVPVGALLGAWWFLSSVYNSHERDA